MGHVFARLTGFGMTLIPVWPYTFERTVDAPGTVSVTRWEGQAARTAIVAGSAEKPSVQLANTQTADEVVEVLAGPAEQVWRIETTPFSVEWPEGFAIDSPPAGDNSTPFMLFGPAGSTIYLQGPLSRDQIPSPARLAAPGQALVDHRTEGAFEAVELAYQHDGAAWQQSHHLVALTESHVLVITAQSPATHAAQVRAAADLMARSVVVRTNT
ncbi:hypothetical protein [Yinghuangia soli]|uniref:Uncharacterized protein n=1 Tax=Yinghuangia soli TaxID=2908204 RepID=A0AA41PY12_9ACTN|nr:hypothetical protein [Yinghuangia soli]MCF2527838.1 hypothetical protein [Yinghuangia soli]